MRRYLCSEETKRKMSIARKGRKHSEETKKKIQDYSKKYFAIHKDKRKGKNNGFYGKTHTKESKEKMGVKGRFGESNPNYGNHKLKGHKLTPIQCEKIRILKLGNKNCLGKKHTEETKRIMSLKAGVNGIPYDYTDYGVEFTEELKETIRKRDGYSCAICKILQKDNIKKLSVHHIDYDKKNNMKENLISLCGKCHVKINFNKSYWKSFLELKMKNFLICI